MDLYDWQKKIVEHKGNITIRGGRQSGKSWAVAERIKKFALENPNGVSLVTSPSERQENFIFDKVKLLMRKQEIKKRMTQKLIVLKNGHLIWKYPIGRTGENVEGLSSVDFVYIDEAIKMTERNMDAIIPMTAEPNKRGLGWITILGNTRGKPEGYFYDTFNNPDFEKVHIKTEDCPHISKEFLAKEKERMGENRYHMIYEGEFVESDYRYFPKELLEKAVTIKSWTIREDWKREHKYFMGIDPARFGKCEAAFVIAEMIKDKVNIVYVETIKKSTMPELLRMTERFNQMFNLEKIYIDGGGIGGGLVDFLKEKLGRKIVEINNSQKGTGGKILKEDLYENVLRLLETGRLNMIRNEELAFSLSEIMYEDERFSGKKSDLAEALIRACWCVKETRYEPKII